MRAQSRGLVCQLALQADGSANGQRSQQARRDPNDLGKIGYEMAQLTHGVPAAWLRSHREQLRAFPSNLPPVWGNPPAGPTSVYRHSADRSASLEFPD